MKSGEACSGCRLLYLRASVSKARALNPGILSPDGSSSHLSEGPSLRPRDVVDSVEELRQRVRQQVDVHHRAHGEVGAGLPPPPSPPGAPLARSTLETQEAWTIGRQELRTRKGGVRLSVRKSARQNVRQSKKRALRVQHTLILY